MPLQPSRALLFSLSMLLPVQVLSQYTLSSSNMYDYIPSTTSSYYSQQTSESTSDTYYGLSTTSSYYDSSTYSSYPGYSSSSYSEFPYSTPSTTYSTSYSTGYQPVSTTTPMNEGSLATTSTSTSTPVANQNAAYPSATPTPWYATTAGKWGLGAGATSCCMCIFGFLGFCLKKRHRKAAKGIYSKLNGKHGKKGHDSTKCGQCSSAYAGGGGQGQPFLYDPHKGGMNMMWQQQAQNGA